MLTINEWYSLSDEQHLALRREWRKKLKLSQTTSEEWKRIREIRDSYEIAVFNGEMDNEELEELVYDQMNNPCCISNNIPERNFSLAEILNPEC